MLSEYTWRDQQRSISHYLNIIGDPPSLLQHLRRLVVPNPGSCSHRSPPPPPLPSLPPVCLGYHEARCNTAITTRPCSGRRRELWEGENTDHAAQNALYGNEYVNLHVIL
ncbi:hypothetical protein E2C01_063718 [Portunus trituberculatus]|uniref:Uncharacterized protein n=1 Tax=Portunus trituberculatus TaxID=210409 RepID=A0A5B7HEF1_PORTR|nr:hypothetical protein [Portunus trituberculatus]